MGNKKNQGKLVWSSEGSEHSSPEDSTPFKTKGDGIVRVSRETKGRKGKGVTLISGVPLPEVELKDLARVLKQRCGSGGTVKNGLIEIQGDHRDTVLSALSAKGWVVKKAGG